MTVPGELLHGGDLDGLVREIDRRAAAGNHDGVLEVRDACLEVARETGRQLWGPAQYAEYRLALEAPAPLAACVVRPGAARFALGPLTEVVAQEHAFAELAGHLPAPTRPVVAQERVLRGEDLTAHPDAGLDDTGLPGRLQPWEPAYALPVYRPAERLDDGPPTPAATGRPLAPRPASAADLPRLGRSLTDLVASWEEQSTGRVRVATVRGDAQGAVTALADDAVRLVPLSLPEAVGRMAWAAASGGAHGRRRGGAAGRSGAWEVCHAATAPASPPDPDELEYHLEELGWYAFDDGAEPTGWHLRLAVAGDGWAAAVDAQDPWEEDA